ncbi:hypothetical protein [Bacteroides salyersiae]|nr:hypothetical protein [Bacteroides salyersiae]MCS3060325.1 hypothetical protein [Bacteroides salyersiae]
MKSSEKQALFQDYSTVIRAEKRLENAEFADAIKKDKERLKTS